MFSKMLGLIFLFCSRGSIFRQSNWDMKKKMKSNLNFFSATSKWIGCILKTLYRPQIVFHTTLWFRSFRKSVKVFSKLPKYRSASTHKGDPGAKLCRMLLRYPERQLWYQRFVDLVSDNWKLIYTRIVWFETRLVLRN